MRAQALSGEAARREKRGRRVVLYVSRAFCSTDQEKKETARSLDRPVIALVTAFGNHPPIQNYLTSPEQSLVPSIVSFWRGKLCL